MVTVSPTTAATSLYLLWLKLAGRPHGTSIASAWNGHKLVLAAILVRYKGVLQLELSRCPSNVLLSSKCAYTMLHCVQHVQAAATRGKSNCAYSTTSWTLPEENAQTWQAELALTLQNQSSGCVYRIG